MKPFKVGQIVRGFNAQTYVVQLAFGREHNSVCDLCAFRSNYGCIMHEVLRLQESVTCTDITPDNTVFKEVDFNNGI